MTELEDIRDKLCAWKQAHIEVKGDFTKDCNEQQVAYHSGIIKGFDITILEIDEMIERREPEQVDFRCHDEESAITISKMFNCLTSYKSFTGDRSGHYHKHTKTGRVVRIWW